jgi:DNA-binding MarR family transcriptional regulator
MNDIVCINANLKMASRVTSRAYDAVLEPFGINVGQFSILRNIYFYQPIAQMNLADRLEMERTTLYRALDILEKRKLIKSENLSDGIAKHLSLTAKGKKTIVSAEKEWKKLQDSYVSKFGKEKLKQLNEILAQVREHFKEV